jgi:hypothetical protein
MAVLNCEAVTKIYSDKTDNNRIQSQLRLTRTTMATAAPSAPAAAAASASIAPGPIYVDTQHEDLVHDAQMDYYGAKLATCSSGKFCLALPDSV